MAKDLYKSYCAKDAVDRIKFDEDIVSELAEGKIQAQFGICLILFYFLDGGEEMGRLGWTEGFFFCSSQIFFKWSNCFDCISFNILI